MKFRSVSTRHSPDGRAFSFAELLLIIIIIAVLAAIAVPNFLAAKTRAKLSRANADLRATRIALESYAADHGYYPTQATREEFGYLSDFPILTTPIAYLDSLPSDPFSTEQQPQEREHYYRYYSMGRWNQVFDAYRVDTLSWALMSSGPNRKYDSDEHQYTGVMNGAAFRYYDPTNGIASSGDLVAVGR